LLRKRKGGGKRSSGPHRRLIAKKAYKGGKIGAQMLREEDGPHTRSGGTRGLKGRAPLL